MSVHDFDITAGDANTGIAVRAAINAALQALASQSNGATDPSVTYPFQVRVDTSATPATVYWRKSDNSAWKRVGYVNSNGVFIMDLKGAVVTKTAAYTATVNDYMILCDATTAAWTLTLPSAATVDAGKEYVVKKTDASVNAITVDPNGAETIDGAATISVFAQHQALVIISDGTNWRKKSVEFASFVRAYKTGNDVILNATWTQISLGGISYDTDNEFGTSTFTAKRAGKYSMKCAITWAINGTSDRWAAFYLNDALYSANNILANSARESIVPHSDDILLAVGDTIKLYGWQGSGGNLSTSMVYPSFLCIHRIG